MGVLNGNLLWAQWVCLMGKYFGCCWGNYCVLNRTLLVCSTGNYWCAQWEVRCWTLLECSMGIYNLLRWTLLGCSMGIQVLNRNLGAQWELICSTGIIICSTGHYLGAQWEVMCSMGNYNVRNWTLLGCSTESYVLNRKL